MPVRGHGKRRRSSNSSMPHSDNELETIYFPIAPTTETIGCESTRSTGSGVTYTDSGTQTEPDSPAPSGSTAIDPSTMYLQGSFENISRKYIESVYLGNTQDERDHWIWHKLEMQHALASLKRSRDSIDKLPDPKFVLPRQPPELPKMTLSERAPQAVEDLANSWQKLRSAITLLRNCTSRAPQMRQACAEMQDPGFLSKMKHQARFWMDSLSHEYDMNTAQLSSTCLLGLVLLSPATKDIRAKPRNLPNNPVGQFGGPPAGGASGSSM